MNSMLAESCSSTYQSMCELQCQEGFNGTGDPSYVCDVLNDGLSVMWMAEGDLDVWRCESGNIVSYEECNYRRVPGSPSDIFYSITLQLWDNIASMTLS